MNTKFLSILFFGFLLIFCCAKNNEWHGTKEIRDDVTYIHNPETGLWNDSKKLVLKEVLSIGIEDGDENYILASISNVEVDKSGNIYLCDFKDNCVKVYNRNGKFIRRIGSNGAGPGELFGPSKTSISQENEIYVYDVGNRRICIFKLNGEFQNSFKISFSIFDMSYIHDGKIIVSAIIIDTPFSTSQNVKDLYHIYDKNGQLISSFGKPILQIDNVHPKQYSVVSVECFKSNLIGVPNFPYRIYWYNHENQLVKVVIKESKIFTQPELIQADEYVPIYSSRGILGRILFFPDGNFFVPVLDLGEYYKENLLSEIKREKFKFPEEIKWFYDFYDNEGYFLQSFPLSENYGILFYIDTEGFVYTKTGPDEIPIVRKYQITFQDK